MIKNVGYFPDIDSFIKATQARDERFVLLVAEETKIDLKLFKKYKNEFYGCIFPQVLFEAKHYTSGVVALSIGEEADFLFVEDMKEPQLNCVGNDMQSFIVFFDGLSSNIDHFIEELFVCSDASVSIMGGGAGKLSLVQEEVLFDSKGMYKNGALIITLSSKLGIGVKHGWTKMVGDFVVTSAEGNRIKQINFENALDFYVENLNTKEKVTPENFFALSKSHPFGIETFSQETIVRDPLMYDDEGIFLAAPIAENSVVSILQGDKVSLIEAVCEATQEALYRIRHIPRNLLVVDCISRALFLEDAFEEELQAIHNLVPNSNMFGVLSIGEIANNSYRYIEVFNKTCVIGAIE